MWVIKTEIDVKKEMEHHKNTGKLIVFFVLFIIGIFSLKIISDKYSLADPSSPPKSWDEIIKILPVYILVSVIFSLLMAGLMLYFSRKKNWLCLKCDRLYRKNIKICKVCGQALVDASLWKWV